MNPAQSEIALLEGKIETAQGVIDAAYGVFESAMDNQAAAQAEYDAKQSAFNQQIGFLQGAASWANANRNAQLTVSTSAPYIQGFYGIPTSGDSYMGTISNHVAGVTAAENAMNAAGAALESANADYAEAEAEYNRISNQENGKINTWENQIDALNAAYASLIAEGIDPELAGQIAFEEHAAEQAAKKSRDLIWKIVGWSAAIIGLIVAFVLLYLFLQKKGIIGKK